MPLIDKTYFIGELDIPNTNNTSVAERLNHFIVKHEREFLISILGYELYTEFAAGLAATTVDSLWTDLRDGAEYYDDRDRLYKWDGLRNATTKQSIIANYVYFHFMRDQATQTTGLGEMTNVAENAVRVSANHKMCRAWNEMYHAIGSLIHFLTVNADYYDTWDKGTAYNILYAYSPINNLGL